MTRSVIEEKRPKNPAWVRQDSMSVLGYPNSGWYHPRTGLFVISAVEVAEADIGPEYHISISKRGLHGSARRCSASESAVVLKQFDLENALEDNHTSIIRNFWMPVAERLVGIECECKAEEAKIVEGDFEWRPLTQGMADRARKIEEDRDAPSID